MEQAEEGPKTGGGKGTAYVSFSAEVNQQTTESLLGLCAKLVMQGYEGIYLLLSTPGGGVMNGITIFNVLRSLPVTLTTHNVGNVDSIGNVIFLAGERRYCCPHATFMFHGVGFDVRNPTRFEEKILKERLDSILSDQTRIGSIISERAKIEADELGGLFLEQKTRDPSYALARGIVHEIRDVQVPPGAPFLQLVFQR